MALFSRISWRWSSATRLALRAVPAGMLLYFAWPLSRPGVLPAFSPLVALKAVVAGAASAVLLWSAAVSVLALLVPRGFCRWLCPLGLARDVLTIKRKPFRWQAKLPALGILVAAFAWPLALWLDPLVLLHESVLLFSGGKAVYSPSSERVLLLAGAAAAVMLVLLAVFPGLWCHKLCPLGGIQDALTCLRQNLGWVFRRLKGRASKSPPSPPEKRAPPPATPRRKFLAGLVLGNLARVALAKYRPEKKQLRPPMVDDEARFLAVDCVRCGACAAACPAGIIKLYGPGSHGWNAAAPSVVFGNDYCHPECVKCGQVCPTGAIPRFSLSGKYRRPMGVAQVNHDLCRIAESVECGFCVNGCPHGALDFSWNAREMSSRVKVKPEVCTGCGCCEYLCPVMPKAITVVPVIVIREKSNG